MYVTQSMNIVAKSWICRLGGNFINGTLWRFKRCIKSVSLFVATTFYNPFYIILQIKIDFCYVPFNLFFSVFGPNSSLETLSVLNLTPS